MAISGPEFQKLKPLLEFAFSMKLLEEKKQKKNKQIHQCSCKVSRARAWENDTTILSEGKQVFKNAICYSFQGNDEKSYLYLN